jgi:hypothetical protein
MGKSKWGLTVKKGVTKLESEWGLSIGKELALIEKVKKYKEGGPEKDNLESDKAWQVLADCHFNEIYNFFKKKRDITPWLAEKLAKFTMERARRSVIAGKYKPQIRRLKIYIKAVTARGVLTGYRAVGESYIDNKIISAVNLRRGCTKDNEDKRDPIEDAPDPRQYIIMDAVNELAEVVFSIGGKPHRLIVFGFIGVLNWEKQTFLTQLWDWLLRKLGKKFCEDYYMESFHTLDQNAFNQCFCGGLLRDLERTVEDVYGRSTDNLEKYYKKRVGKVPLKAFFGGKDSPANVIDKWMNKVRSKIEEAYGLG